MHGGMSLTRSDSVLMRVNLLRDSNRMRPSARIQNQQTKGMDSLRWTSHVKQGTQPQRPDWPKVTVTWHTSIYKVNTLYRRFILKKGCPRWHIPPPSPFQVSLLVCALSPVSYQELHQGLLHTSTKSTFSNKTKKKKRKEKRRKKGHDWWSLCSLYLLACIFGGVYVSCIYPHTR